MAKDDERPTAAEKGKGKVEDIRELNGDKDEDKPKTDKDGKPMVNGKKPEEPREGLSSTGVDQSYGDLQIDHIVLIQRS